MTSKQKKKKITNHIYDTRTDFCRLESFLMKRSPDISALCETNLNSSTAAINEFSVLGYFPLKWKYSRIHVHDLGIYIWGKFYNGKWIVYWVPGIIFSYTFDFLCLFPFSQECNILNKISHNVEISLCLLIYVYITTWIFLWFVILTQ